MQQGLESSGGLGTEDTSKKPATALGTGRAKASKRLVLLYGWMRYVRSPPAGLKDSTGWPAFFIAPAMKPGPVCFFHPMVCIIPDSVAPFLRRSTATTWAVLLPGAVPWFPARRATAGPGPLSQRR